MPNENNNFHIRHEPRRVKRRTTFECRVINSVTKDGVRFFVWPQHKHPSCPETLREPSENQDVP